MKFGAFFLFMFLVASPILMNGVWGEEDAQSESGSGSQQETTQTNVNQTEVASNETKKLEPSPDVSTLFVFPSTTSKKVVIGKSNDFLFGFSNNGNGVFNVTSVFASLMYPMDHRYYIQNFTRQYYFETVQPSEQRSFFYSFTPDALLEARPYGVVVSVFYSDLEGANFTSVVFNTTLDLEETQEAIDSTALFTYVGALAIAGLVGFAVYKAGRNMTKKSTSKRVKYNANIPATVLDNEWLEGTAAMKSPKSGPRSPKTAKIGRAHV